MVGQSDFFDHSKALLVTTCHFLSLSLSQRSKTDVGNFDTDFTKEEAKLTPTDKNIIANINQDEFKDFSFVNPQFVSDSLV